MKLKPILRNAASVVAGFVIGITIVLVGGVVVVYVYSTQPKYYCCWPVDIYGNHDGSARCVILTSRNEAKKKDLEYISGPWRDAAICGSICATNNNPGISLEIPQELSGTITVEISNDGAHWKDFVTVPGQYDCFEAVGTNTTMQMVDQASHFRARID